MQLTLAPFAILCGSLATAMIIPPITPWSMSSNQSNYTEEHALIPTRDNATLYTRIYFNETRDANKMGVLYVQNPYGLDFNEGLLAQWLALIAMKVPIDTPIFNGTLHVGVRFAYVIQETRSRYNSTGSFDYFNRSREDAEDTIAWLKAQPWCDGNVIPIGCSAMGNKAILATSEEYAPLTQNLGLFNNGLYSAAYRGGALQQQITEGMLVFTNETALMPEIRAHEADNGWWGLSRFEDWKSIKWPTLMWAGWFDIFQKDTLEAFDAYQQNSSPDVRHKHRLVVDPLGHCGLHGYVGNLNATAVTLVQATYGLATYLQYKCFEGARGTWLSDAAARAKWDVLTALLPPIVWMVMSSDGGFVSAGESWPVYQPTKLFLGHNHTLNSTAPSSSSSVTFTYDPADPLPTRGGFQFFSNDMVCGPADQRWGFEDRGDIMSFDGPILTEPFAITGPVRASLWLSSTANDTDFIVKLVDVSPAEMHGLPGQRVLITDGIARMRWQNSSSRAQLIVPGRVYETEIDMWRASYVLKPGHRIGIDVTSSSYPAYTPNPNNGLPLSINGSNVTANNTIHLALSYVEIPVVSVKDLPYWNLPIPFPHNRA